MMFADLSLFMNRSPLLVSPLINCGVSPRTPSAIISLIFEACVTSKNFTAEALSEPLELRDTKSVLKLPKTDPIP
jgi:hypothetical protein